MSKKHWNYSHGDKYGLENVMDNCEEWREENE